MSVQICKHSSVMFFVLIFCLVMMIIIRVLSDFSDRNVSTKPIIFSVDSIIQRKPGTREAAQQHHEKKSNNNSARDVEKTSGPKICSKQFVSSEGRWVIPTKNLTTMKAVNDGLLGKFIDEAHRENDVANSFLAKGRSTRRLKRESDQEIDAMFTENNLIADIDDYRLLPGGHWIPLTCKPKWKVAIVVPFRNRFQHLPIFLRHTVPFLKRQQLEFSIFIAEQKNDLPFNRAMVMNVGFVEALNFTKFDCVVFHDVDHLLININNYYGCDKMPRNFISGTVRERNEVGVPYDGFFGAVSGVTREQFFAINGLPNVYWGWGGEDDDFHHRVVANGFQPSRPEGDTGYSVTIKHSKKDSSSLNMAKYCLSTFCGERMYTDGISNLVYEPPTIELHPLYTNISVNIQKLPWNPKWMRCELITTVLIVITKIATVLLIVIIFITFLYVLSKRCGWKLCQRDNI